MDEESLAINRKWSHVLLRTLDVIKYHFMFVSHHLTDEKTLQRCYKTRRHAIMGWSPSKQGGRAMAAAVADYSSNCTAAALWWGHTLSVFVTVWCEWWRSLFLSSNGKRNCSNISNSPDSAGKTAQKCIASNMRHNNVSIYKESK